MGIKKNNYIEYFALRRFYNLLSNISNSIKVKEVRLEKNNTHCGKYYKVLNVP